MVDRESQCKRPYELGKRLEALERTKVAILNAARAELESNGHPTLTMETLARKSGVSRQTVHNLFGTRAAVLETLFDQVARQGGMEKMPAVMRRDDGELMLYEFVRIFVEFWWSNRLFIRRIHGMAALDPELGSIVDARNRRRKSAAGRVLEKLLPSADARKKQQASAALYAITSFEFFDAFVEDRVELVPASAEVFALAKKAVT